jgi:hypothetical protein
MAIKVGGTTVIDDTRNLTLTGNINLSQAFFETANVTASAVTANVTLVARDSGICYFTSNATANTTVDLTGLTELAVGGAATISLLMTNGATAYKVNTVQVNGAAANVVKWSGGTAPTSGNAANVDIYSFTVIKTATSTHSVFASQSQFGG